MRKSNQQKKALRKVLKKQKMKKIKARKMKLNPHLASNSSASRVGEILGKIGRQKRLLN